MTVMFGDMKTTEFLIKSGRKSLLKVIKCKTTIKVYGPHLSRQDGNKKTEETDHMEDDQMIPG